MARLLPELVEKLRKAHADRLISVVLYGSAAADENDRFSDLNVLTILSEITPRELGEAEPVFRWWREMNNPAPLLLGREELATSTDCFPIEFTDIKARHRILFGPDLVSGIVVDYSFYRAQVEHELRAKLLRLRQKAGGVLSERDLLLRLMADSLSTFCVLFRHVLLLGGFEAKYEKHQVIEAAREHLEVDAAPFLALLSVREEKTKAKDVQPGPLFREYLKQIQIVVERVDQMQK